MFSSKFLALAWMCVCSTAFARVHVHADITVDRPITITKRTIATDIHLDAGESSLVYSSDDMRIEALLKKKP